MKWGREAEYSRTGTLQGDNSSSNSSFGCGMHVTMKSKMGTSFITSSIYTWRILAPCCNRMFFSQRCLPLLCAWRRCYNPSSSLQMSNINLLNIRQAASHPWCLPQWQGATHGQGGGRRQGEHSYVHSASSPPSWLHKSTPCFICSSRWGDDIFEPLEIN